MRAKLSAREAFNVIITRASVPPMNGKPHAAYLDRFEYTVTRDALHLFGVDFPQAENMAHQFDGSARRRFGKCIRRLPR